MKELLLQGLTSTKQNADSLRSEIAEKVINGEIDPIKVMSAVKFFEKVFEGDSGKNNGLNHIIKPYVVDELEKDKSRSDYYGFKVEIKEAGVKYDYSNCGHTELNELYEKQEEIKARIAEIEKTLKTIPQGKSIPMIIYGEAVEVFGPIRTSSTSPNFRLL